VTDRRLTVVSNELEAEMLRGLLRANGIACWYRKTDFAAGASDAVISMTGPTEVLGLDERQLDAARKVLERTSPAG
jgi:hypothetical protein